MSYFRKTRTTKVGNLTQCNIVYKCVLAIAVVIVLFFTAFTLASAQVSGSFSKVQDAWGACTGKIVVNVYGCLSNRSWKLLQGSVYNGVNLYTGTVVA